MKAHSVPGIVAAFILTGPLVTPCVFAQSAPAGQQAIVFKISPQPLDSALVQFSQQSGMQLVVTADMVRTKKTRGVEGMLEPARALAVLLEGSGLEYNLVNARSFAIHAAGAHETARADTATGTPVAAMQLASRSDISDTAAGNAAQDAAAARAAGSTPTNDGAAGAIPEILVKGGRVLNTDIKRTRDDAQPYVVLGRDKIEQSTAQNLEQFLRDRLPMNVVGLDNSQRPTAGGNQSSINLRGLGTNQTLILINGRRTVGGGSFGGSPTQPDINGIPLSAIERIEILPGTASGIYGGGATGGVVNIIMRQDYTGAEVKATYGNTFDSDVATRRIDLSAGFNLEGGKTNVLVTSSYSDQNLMQLRERSFLVDRAYNIVRANDPAFLLTATNIPLGSTPNIRSASGANLQLKALYGGTNLNSPITHIPAGYAGVTSGVGPLVANAGAYNTALSPGWQFNGGPASINTAATNTALGATFRREFSSSINAYLETAYTDVDTSVPAVTSAGAATSPYRVLASSVNNPFTEDVLVTFPTGVSPSGETFTEMRQFRATGGVIVALPGRWQGIADYTWGQSRRSYKATNLAATPVDQGLVSAGTLNVLRDTSTYPVDLTPYLAPSLSELLPLHVKMQDVALRFSGPVLDLPAGSIGVSSLLEYREETIDDAYQLGAPAFFYPTKKQSVRSAYLETKIPLFSAQNRKPGIEELELQLAVRADSYRTSGSTPFIMVGSGTPLATGTNETDSVNPTIALRYQPIQDVAVRLSYATGFVAPDVSQLATTTDPSPLTVNDPRRGGGQVVLPGSAILRGGNPNLKPEKSENWSAGFIFTPSVLPGLRLSLDYLRVEKTDNIAIYPTSAQGIINDESLLPGRVTRGNNLPGDPVGWAGPITVLDVTFFNIAKAEVEAFDAQLDYGWSTRFGNFNFNTVVTKQTHYKTQGLAGQPVIENVGYGFSFPRKLAGNAELRWQREGWTVGWISRYHDSYMVANPATPGTAAVITRQGNGGEVSSQTYHDMFFGWRPDVSSPSAARIFSGTEVQLNIRNVLDKTPPFEANLYSLLRNSYYSPIGDGLQRSYQLSFRKQF